MADIKTILTLDDSQFQTKIRQAETTSSNLGNKLTAVGQKGEQAFNKLSQAADSARSRVDSLVSLMVGAGLAAFAKSALDSVSGMVDLANATGVATQTMLEFQLAALASGKTGEDLANMIQRMNVSAQDAADGNLNLRSAFSQLGISFEYLKTHSPEEAFKLIASRLAEMEDPAKRAALASEIMGKQARSVPWKDLSSSIEQYSGTQSEAAKSAEAAKKVMDELAVGLQATKNEFVNLMAPITQFASQFIDGMSGAKVAATGLAGAMGLFAAAGTLSALRSIVSIVGTLGAAFVGTTVSATANTAALTLNSRALDTFMTGALGRVGTATAALATAQAELNAMMMVGPPTALAYAKALDAVAAAEARVAVATEAMAVTSVQAAPAITAAGVAASGAATGMTAATVATGGLVARLSALVPVAVAAAAALYSPGLNQGEDALVEKSKEIGKLMEEMEKVKPGFLDDYFKLDPEKQKAVRQALINAKAAKDAAEAANIIKTKEETPTPNGLPSVLNPNATVVDPNAAALESLKLQTRQLIQNNDLTTARLQLENDLVGKVESQRVAALAAFDAEAAKKKDIMRIDGEILRLQKEQANSAGKVDNTSRIKELENQKKVISDMADKTAQIKADTVLKQEAEKMSQAYLEAQLKVQTEIKNIRLQADQLTMTNDEIKLSNIQKQYNAEVEGIAKLRQEQLGRKLTAEELADIEGKLKPAYDEQIAATQQLINKSREFNTGWTKAWKDYNDNATNAAEQAKTLFNTLSGAFESVFEQMVRDGKVNWKSLLQDMTVQLMKSDVQRLFAGMMGGTTGATSSGGVFSTLAKWFSGSFANGGYIPAGAYGITGENGPEYVNGPAQITPMPGMTGDTYNVNITAMDAKSVQQLLSQHSDLIYGLSVKGQRNAGGR